MKTTSGIAGILLLCAVVFESWTVGGRPSDCLRSRTDYEQVAKGYSSLLTDIVRKCPVDLAVFVPDTTCDTRWLTFPTAVHEALHTLNRANQPFQFAGRPTFRAYYIDSENTLRATIIADLPRSKIIVGRTPVWFKEVDTRFKTYIEDTVQDASANGLFGLVEEFSAYRCSMEAYITLFSHTHDRRPTWLATNFPSLLYSGNDAALAYYEFHMYMSAYVDCLRNDGHEQYEALRSSGVLRVMEQVDHAFADAITKWNAVTRDYVAKEGQFSFVGDQLEVAGQSALWETRIPEITRAAELLGQVQTGPDGYRPLLLK